MALTIKEIDSTLPGAKDRKLADEKGLYLLVAKSGSKRWQLKYRFHGTEKKLSLGVYPEVSLKAARAKRDEARGLIAQGRDPSRVRQENRLQARLANANTFGAIASEFIAKRADDGDASICETTKAKTEWLLSLVEPTLGKLPVSEITAPLLLSALTEVQASGRKETARRLRSFVGRVLNYAIATGRRTEANPAPALHRALSAPSVRNHPAIVDRVQLGSLLKAIDGYGGFAATGAALRISAHLFQRPGEIRKMKWVDLDLGKACWTVPAGDTKKRREHLVPLSRQAIAIIRSMVDFAGTSEFVFTSHDPKKPLSENAVNGALRRLGYAGVMTAHGFRSTASSLLNESGRWNPDAIERALAHQDGNAVRAVYNRTAYWPERVEMMQWWSDELDTLKAASR